MLFVMDVGNTNTVFGLYDGDKLLGNWRIVTTNYRTGDELRIFLHMLLQSEGFDPKAVKGCCISSVVPQINRGLQEACRDGFNVQPVLVVKISQQWQIMSTTMACSTDRVFFDIVRLP